MQNNDKNSERKITAQNLTSEKMGKNGKKNRNEREKCDAINIDALLIFLSLSDWVWWARNKERPPNHECLHLSFYRNVNKCTFFTSQSHHLNGDDGAFFKRRKRIHKCTHTRHNEEIAMQTIALYFLFV